MYDVLVAGAGLYGAAAARDLTERGYRVAVVEKRHEPGGNCADELRGGILVGRHGGHIFHTNSARVWQWANRYADFTPYTHRVAARAGDNLYSFPVNLLTLNQLYGVTTPQDAARLLADPAIVADLERTFFVGYSEKQWGKPYAEISRSTTGRIPWRATYDDRYFADTYQGLPSGGYSAWIANILAGIPAVYGDDFTRSKDYWLRKVKRVIYTGPLDALFGFEAGRLEYRSLRFEHHTAPGDFQGCATVNYCDAAVPYTRTLEWKHYGWQKSAETVYTYEYPAAYDGTNEPYYPVKSPANTHMHGIYATRAAACGWLEVGGRLGSYQYLNMDQAIAGALALVERMVKA